MIRLIAQGMTSLALLFCVALSAIHARPYDDGGLSAQLKTQLVPENCGCFLGIRPGETTRVQALLLLRSHPWVGQIILRDDQTITWGWSGQQPAFLTGRSARLIFDQGVVATISIQTSAQIADLAFAFGAPDAAYYFTWQVRDSSRLVLNYFEERATYHRAQFQASTSSLCPLTNARMWALPVTLTFPAPSAHSQLLGVVRNAFVPAAKGC